MASVTDFFLSLQNMFSGHGPEPSALHIPGMIIVIIAAITVVYSFYRAIKVSIWPVEKDRGHIKYRILEEDEGCAH